MGFIGSIYHGIRLRKFSLLMTPAPLSEVEWLRLMLHLYQRTEYPESCCPWEQAMRNRLNEVAGQGQLFLHGKVVE